MSQQTLREKFNHKHLGTLKDLLGKRNVSWGRVRSLLERAGAQIKHGQGSAVKARLGDACLNLHLPHGKGEAHLDGGRIRNVCDFLRQAHII